jgi:hypothetical protein
VDIVEGGDGDDSLVPDHNGTDDTYSGGPGSDLIDYGGVSARLDVSLNNVKDDGPSSERDDVRDDVETIIGSYSHDQLSGNGGVNAFFAAGGNDRIDSRDTVADLVVCGPGFDTVTADNLDNVLEEGDDRCERVDRVVTVPTPPAAATPPAAGTPVTPGPTTITRLRPARLTLSLSPASDLRGSRKFVASGRLTPPAGITAQDACAGIGLVSVQTKVAGTTLSTRRVRLQADCTYRSKLTLRNPGRFGRATQLRFNVRFLGNARLLPTTNPVRRNARIRRARS